MTAAPRYCTTSKDLTNTPGGPEIAPILPAPLPPGAGMWTLRSTAVGTNRIFWTWEFEPPKERTEVKDPYNGEYGVMKSAADQERESRAAGNPPKFELMEDFAEKNRIIAEHLCTGMVVDYAGLYRKIIEVGPDAALGRTFISFDGMAQNNLSVPNDQEFVLLVEKTLGAVEEVTHSAEHKKVESEIVLMTKADGNFGIYVNPPEGASFTRQEMERVATAFEGFLPEKEDEDEDEDEPCDPPLPTFYEKYAALVLAPPFPPYPPWEDGEGVRAAWLLAYPAAAKYLEKWKEQARKWNIQKASIEELKIAEEQADEEKKSKIPKGWTPDGNGGWNTQSRRSDDDATGEGADRCDGCMHAREEDRCMVLDGKSRRPPSIGRAVGLWVDGDEQGVCPGRKEVPDPPPEGWTRNENGGWVVEGSADWKEYSDYWYMSAREALGVGKEVPAVEVCRQMKDRIAETGKLKEELERTEQKLSEMRDQANRWEVHARDWYLAAQEAFGTGDGVKADELRERMKSAIAEIEPLKQELDRWLNWGRKLTGNMFLGEEKIKHQIVRKFQEIDETEKRLKRVEKELHLWRDWGLSHSGVIYSNEGLRGNISNKLNAAKG